MKNKTKIWTSLLTGSFLAITLLFSSVGFAKTRGVNELSAETGDVAATFKSSDLIKEANAGYRLYDNEDWIITFGGGGNKSIGANSDANGAKLTLGSYVNVMGFDSSVKNDSKFYSAVISKNAIEDIGKISISIGAIGKGGSNTKVYLAHGASFDGNFTLITQVNNVSTTLIEHSFSTLVGGNYYALVFYNTVYFRLDNVEANFYAGENARTLESLSVTGVPAKTSYFVGDSFDPDGLTVKAIYDDGSNKDVTDKCSFTPNPLTLGTTDILISYTEDDITKTHTLTGAVAVTERHLISLEITTNPAKMDYFIGDSFDPTGMIIKAKYDLGPDIEDYKGYDYSPKSTFTTMGSKTITISDSEDGNIFTTLLVQVSEIPPITELFISEYIEGSSNNKGLEIYNGTGSSLSLSGYELRLYANKATSPTQTLSLTGTLNNDSTYTIVNSGSSSALKNKATLELNGVTGFNGDDAVGLYKNGALIDLIGIIGEQKVWTGLAANGVTGSTENKTLVRTATTLGPNTTFTWSEWNCYNVDTFTYFGSHSVNLSTPAHVTEAIAYGETFLSETSAGCVAQSLAILEGVWADLETQYLALSDDAKDYFASLTPSEVGNDAEHTLARYSYIISKYKILGNFMVDSDGHLLFNINLVDHVSSVDYPKIVMITLILVTLTLVSGTYLIVRRKHKRS